MSKMASHKPFGHLQHKLWQKEKVKLAIWLPTTKSRESTQPRCVKVECDTLLENYKFASDLIPINALHKELWVHKVPRIQTGTISRFFFGNLGIKNHSDVGAVEKCKEYYMGEGGGFLRVWAVVSLVNLRSLVACPNTKGVPENELINLLVGLMQVWVNN